MPYLIQILAGAFFLSLPFLGVSQNSGTPQGNAQENESSFFKNSASQHTILIEYYTPTNSNQSDRIEKIIGNALNFYIDESVQIAEDKLILKKSKKNTLKDLNSIVSDGVHYYDYKEISKFKGFSDRVEAKLDEIIAFDFTIYPLDGMDSLTVSKQKYYYAQKELNDLKLLLNIEIGNFTNDNLLILTDKIDAGIHNLKEQELLDEIRKFELYDTLEPIEVELSDNTIAIIKSKDDSSLIDLSGNALNSDYSQEIFEMLKANNVKLDAMQERIFKLESAILSNASTPAPSEMDLDAVKKLFQEYADGNTGVLNSGSSIANLPKEVQIVFTNASSYLSIGNQLILNEVIDILGHNKNMGVIITGYADLTGSSQKNYELSKKRANAVRNLALKSGIDDRRLIVNYFGDSKSNSINPSDRKVVIEFVSY